MLLEREILDGAEVLSLIKGRPTAAACVRWWQAREDETQQVIRPEGGRRLPGLSEGERPQPA